MDNVRAVFSDYDAETLSAEDLSRNWRQRKECGGGIPYDFACYAVNACGHFSGGLPVRVYATGDVSEKYDIVNRLYGHIVYDNECVGIIESSKKSSFSQEHQISCAHIIYEAADKLARNTKDNPLWVVPHNRGNAIVEGNLVLARLPKLSWNVIRLNKKV